MKTALLPLALLPLTLPGAALAYPYPAAAPTKIVYRTVVTQPGPAAAPAYPMAPSTPYTTYVSPAYTASTYASPVYATPGYATPAYTVPGYGVPGYGVTASQPVRTVVRYKVAPAAGMGTIGGYGAPYGLAAAPVSLAQRCAPDAGRALLGAAMGGLASIALAPNGKDRRWAVPVGAAIGGLGGLATGC